MFKRFIKVWFGLMAFAAALIIVGLGLVPLIQGFINWDFDEMMKMYKQFLDFQNNGTFPGIRTLIFGTFVLAGVEVFLENLTEKRRKKFEK